MAANICPCCGQAIRAKRAIAPIDHPGPEASNSALHAYYKATAPREDLLFVRRAASTALQATIDTLLTGKPTAADARRVFDLRRHELTEQPVQDDAVFWAKHQAMIDRATAAFGPVKMAALKRQNGCWPPLMDEVERAEMRRKYEDDEEVA